MGKKPADRVLAETEAKAFLATIRTSPRKLNLVAESIRGLKADVALNALTFSKRRIAVIVRSVLQSAIANAENNNKLRPESLRIKEAVAGTATTLKRFQPKARGSAGPILKRRCHIKITLSDE